MSEKTQNAIVKWTDIAFKIAVIVGPVIMAMVMMYLERNFVPRSEFEKFAPRIDVIERTLLIMAAQDKVLADHEQRLREMERRSMRDGETRQ